MADRAFSLVCCCCEPTPSSQFVSKAIGGQPYVKDISAIFSAAAPGFGGVDKSRWRLYESGFGFLYAGYGLLGSTDGGLFAGNGVPILGTDYLSQSVDPAAYLTVDGKQVSFTSNYEYQGFMELQCGCLDEQGRVIWP